MEQKSIIKPKTSSKTRNKSAGLVPREYWNNWLREEQVFKNTIYLLNARKQNRKRNAMIDSTCDRHSNFEFFHNTGAKFGTVDEWDSNK